LIGCGFVLLTVVSAVSNQQLEVEKLGSQITYGLLKQARTSLAYVRCCEHPFCLIIRTHIPFSLVS